MNALRSTLLALAALLALSLLGCWNWNFSRDSALRPPDRPRADHPQGGKMPEWMRNPPVSENELFASNDIFRSNADKSFSVHVRLHAARHAPLADRSAIRIEIPIGYSGQPIGLAELTALALSDVPDTAGQRPSLRARVTQLGGDLVVAVGAKWTRFTIHTKTAHWKEVLDEVAERLRETPITQPQFAVLQDRLIRMRLEEWLSDPAYAYVSQWDRYGDLDRTEIIGAIQDRYLAEVMLFHRRHYQPDGSTVGVWIPEVSRPRTTVSTVRFALAAWQDGPKPPAITVDGGRAKATAPPPTGVRWIEGTSHGRVAIVIPDAADSLEWRVMMECFTLGGLGGRLGKSIENRLHRYLVFRAHPLGSGDRRFLVLQSNLEATSAAKLWEAVHEAWTSLADAPPTGTELANAKARVRLRLARRQDQPDRWLDAARDDTDRRTAARRTAARRTDSDGGPVRDLRSLERIEHVRGIAREWRETRLAMVVTGGVFPADAPEGYTRVKLATPESRQSTESAPALVREANTYLELAVKAVADKKTFLVWKGYDVAETWKDPGGLTLRVTTFARPPDEMTRITDILGTRIETAVRTSDTKTIAGTETVGAESRELSAGEAADLRSEANRHPLALLAGWAQDKIEFRWIGMRGRSGRKVALLERVDPTRPRLRVTIDAKSGLLRSVETIRHRADLGAVLVRESYDDYRRAGDYRVPMHRVTKVGNVTVGVDCIVNSFKVVNR